MRYLLTVLVLTLLTGLCGCLGSDSRSNPVFATYAEAKDRSDIAIVRMDLSSTPRVLMVDGLELPAHTCYILLEPGRHRFRVSTAGGGFGASDKFLEAQAGHTYRLKSNRGLRIDEAGLLEGSGGLPVFLDISDDSQLHLSHLPPTQGEMNE